MATAAGGAGAASLAERLVAADGSAGHRWAAALARGGAAGRDLADACHALCLVHGRHPGLADEALARGVQPAAAPWLAAVAAGFAAERALLAALAAAAGPLPSTPGHAESEAALLGQRHALAMLARSDRVGCASGAVAALALDWPAVRVVLARAAAAFGLPAPAPLADLAAPAGLAVAAATPAAERAVGFGAQQLVLQHRGLWDLLEARAHARR